MFLFQFLPEHHTHLIGCLVVLLCCSPAHASVTNYNAAVVTILHGWEEILNLLSINKLSGRNTMLWRDSFMKCIKLFTLSKVGILKLSKEGGGGFATCLYVGAPAFIIEYQGFFFGITSHKYYPIVTQIFFCSNLKSAEKTQFEFLWHTNLTSELQFLHSNTYASHHTKGGPSFEGCCSYITRTTASALSLKKKCHIKLFRL